MEAAGADPVLGNLVKGEDDEDNSDLDGRQAQDDAPTRNSETQKDDSAAKEGQAQEKTTDVPG